MDEGLDASSSMHTSIAFWWNSSSIFIACYINIHHAQHEIHEL